MCLGNFVPTITKIANDPEYDFMSKYQDANECLSESCAYSAPDDPKIVRACKLSVLHLNIRSLYKNLMELKLLITQLNPDIILLCETFLHKNNEGKCAISGYKSYFNNRATGSGGGVAIYIRHNMQCEIIESLKISNDCLESIFLKCYH